MFISFLLLILILFLTLAIFINPIIGIYLIIVVELWMASSDIFLGVSPRYFIIPLTLATLIFDLRKKATLFSKSSKNMLIVILVFFVWIIIDQLLILRLGLMFADFYRYLGRFGMHIATAYIFQYYINDEYKLKRVLKFLVCVAAISGFVGLLQAIVGEPFYQLRNFLQKDIYSASPDVNRVCGLSYYYIPFSYDMLSVIFLPIGILVAHNKRLKNKERLFWLVTSFLMLAGILFSFTRSAIFGFVVSLLILFFIKGRYKKSVLYVVLFVVIFLLVLFGSKYETSKRVFNFSDFSAHSRVVLTKISFFISINNPLGVGVGMFNERAAEHEYYKYVHGMYGAYIVTQTGSHNHLMNVVVYFGWIGLLIALLFYYHLYKSVIFSYYNSYNEFTKGLSMGFIGFFISYLIHSSFHNAGIFKGGDVIWIILGLIMSVCNLINHRRLSIRDFRTIV